MAPPRTTAYCIGLDLGQKNDYTALTVLRQRAVPTGAFTTMRSDHGYVEQVAVTESHYDMIHADRWRGRPYHEVPGIVKDLYPALRQAVRDEIAADPDWSDRMPDRNVPTNLIVDGTGVGIAVVDTLRKAGLGCVSVTIHGGDAVSRDGNEYRIPKRELVAVLQVLLQMRRLGISNQIPLAEVITRELENFRAKITLTGHDTYGAGADWRDGNHDDLVLSVAMAAWYGEHHKSTGLDALKAYQARQHGR